jgi:hypothetical protein
LEKQIKSEEEVKEEVESENEEKPEIQDAEEIQPAKKKKKKEFSEEKKKLLEEEQVNSLECAYVIVRVNCLVKDDSDYPSLKFRSVVVLHPAKSKQFNIATRKYCICYRPSINPTTYILILMPHWRCISLL